MIISFSSDRTGFPLVHLTELGYDVHLLPITKVQFEQMAASDKTYETIFKHASALNPKSSEPCISQGFSMSVLPPDDG